MGVEHRPVGTISYISMCMSHHSHSDAATEISNAGKHRGRPTESPNPAKARMATVPVVRDTGTGEGWPIHIRKSSGLKGQAYQPCWGDKGKVVVPATKAKVNS